MSNTVTTNFSWESLNQLLLSEKLEFSKPTTADKKMLFKLTFNEPESLQKGIQNALSNFKVIANHEHDFNDGQPVNITEKHLEWAKVFIESGNFELTSKTDFVLPTLNAQSDVSIGAFLLDCYALAQQNPRQFHINTDNKRKALISTLFGDNCSEEVLEPVATDSEYKQPTVSCSQFIFDSADVASAVDELIINLTDRTWPPWRIQSVYVQESLKNVINELITPERLNVGNDENKVILTDADIQKNGDLAKRFGGKLIKSNDERIRLLFDVPPKYLETTIENIRALPVVVNFFRTPKELMQLIKSDFDPAQTHLASVWTENIGLFYEIAAEINAEIIWSNSIGLFDKRMPSLNGNLDRNRVKSCSSSINNKGKYAVHVVCDADKNRKYLHISYGKTFAN